MASKKDQSTIKENGHIVMKALKDIEKTPTLMNLTRFISTTYDTDLEEVKEPLKNILESGMALGIFTRKNGKYFLYGEESEEDEKEEGELVDATRRRRKSSTKSSKKSRSRSRRKSSSRNKSTGRSKSKSRSGSRRRRPRSRMQDNEE